MQKSLNKATARRLEHRCLLCDISKPRSMCQGLADTPVTYEPRKFPPPAGRLRIDRYALGSHHVLVPILEDPSSIGHPHVVRGIRPVGAQSGGQPLALSDG